MAMTIVARRRCGLISAVIATALGMAPPRPSPVRKRNAVSVPTPSAKRRRERQDAERHGAAYDDPLAADPVGNGLNTNVPSSRPNNPALNTDPSAPRPSCHSRANAGAT